MIYSIYYKYRGEKQCEGLFLIDDEVCAYSRHALITDFFVCVCVCVRVEERASADNWSPCSVLCVPGTAHGAHKSWLVNDPVAQTVKKAHKTRHKRAAHVTHCAERHRQTVDSGPLRVLGLPLASG